MAGTVQKGGQPTAQAGALGFAAIRPAQAVLAFGILSAVLTVLATALVLWQLRAAELARGERELSNLAATIGEQTAQAISNVERQLRGTEERLRRDLPNGYLVDAKSVYTMMRARIDGMPQVRSLSMVDAEGRLKFTSFEYPVPDVFLGDRAYFTVHKERPTRDLYIGQPVRHRLDGQWRVPMSRRLDAPDGAFAGVVLAMLDPPYFAAFYRSLDLGEDTEICLYLRDGTFLSGNRNAEESIGKSFADTPVFEALGAQPGPAETVPLLRTDGPSTTLIAYRELRDFPFVVAVSAHESVLLANWRQHAMSIAAGVAGILLIIAVATFWLRRVLIRDEHLTAALATSEGTLKGIVDSAMDAIVTVDADQRVVVFNGAAEKMFGCPASEALGAPLDRFLPQRFRDSHRTHVRRFGETGVTSRTMGDQQNLYGLRTNGEEFPIEASISVAERDGAMLYTAIVRDVTLRRRAEEALRKFSRVIEQTASTVVITDTDGIIEYVNPRFVESSGYAVEEAIGGRPSVLKSGETPPEVYADLWRTIKEGRVWQGEFHNRRKDGSLYWESAIISPIRNDRGQITHFVAVKDDITARKRAEEALRTSHQQLRELSAALQDVREEERTRIARELHDELGQHLTGLKMDLTWMNARVRDDQPELSGKIAAMRKLIDATVAATRKIASELRPMMLDDLGLVAAIEWLGQDFSKRTGVEVAMDLDLGRLELPDALATSVYRIVQESLTNVARHADAQHVDIALRHADGRLVLSICDDGKGMDAAAAQAGRTCGLLGMRERAYMLGGELRIASEPGDGTTVEVTIDMNSYVSREPA